ncbi:hypothetical protein M407DRAFT_32510 [Tulasnella calospora MUT 4182]|uniref:Uncharacterized protein n=1 Tax=Tulasnella calospora MUT 4182 TaxID=1051891 RepID=A0A0C3K8Q5_9AGAM|nr:hypothetical protein M407DRAFT_32510 [Tulasnella calospora MUT 4182]
MIRWVDLRERLDALELYLCWRDEVWLPEKTGEGEERGDGDEDGERERDGGEKSESMVKKRMGTQNEWSLPDPIADNVDYSLNKRPHLPRTALNNFIALFEILDFLTDLLHYFKTKSVTGIPIMFANLDIWTQLRILLPVANDFIKPEWRRIRAQPEWRIFDAVLVDDGEAEVVGLQGAISLHS